MTAKLLLVVFWVLGVGFSALADERSAGPGGESTFLVKAPHQTEAHWPSCEDCGGGQGAGDSPQGWSFAGAWDVFKDRLRVRIPFVSVCARTPAIKDAIVRKILKDCSKITSQDLSSVTSLRIPFQDLSRIRRRDLSGLENLKALFFDPPPPPPAQEEEKKPSRSEGTKSDTPHPSTARL